MRRRLAGTGAPPLCRHAASSGALSPAARRALWYRDLVGRDSRAFFFSKVAKKTVTFPSSIECFCLWLRSLTLLLLLPPLLLLLLAVPIRSRCRSKRETYNDSEQSCASATRSCFDCGLGQHT